MNQNLHLTRAALLASAVFALLSCLGEPTFGPNSVVADPPDTTVTLQCDATTYSVRAFVLNGDGCYVMPTLVKNDSTYYVGSAVFVPDSVSDTLLSLTVSSYAGIPGGYYMLRVASADQQLDTRSQANRISASDAGMVWVPEYTQPAMENHSCCTDPPAPDGDLARGYAVLQCFRYPVTGASARISARYGKLCGYPDSGASAFSVAWTGAMTEVIDQQGDTEQVWGQCGLGSVRNHAIVNPLVVWSDSTSVYEHMYIEYRGFNYDQDVFLSDFVSVNPDGIEPPLEGQTWEFSCRIDTSTGTWYFGVNDVWLWDHFQDSLFLLVVPIYAQFGGEVTHMEDDMPGTVDNPCVFSEMQYEQPGSGFVTLFERQGDIEITSPSWYDGWTIQRDEDVLRIWDNDPNPY